MKLIEQKCKEDCHKLFGVDPDFNPYPDCWDNFGKIYSARKFYEAGWRAACNALADKTTGFVWTALDKYAKLEPITFIKNIKTFGEEEI